MLKPISTSPNWGPLLNGIPICIQIPSKKFPNSFSKTSNFINFDSTHFLFSQIPQSKQCEYYFHYQPTPTTPFPAPKTNPRKTQSTIHAKKKNNNFLIDKGRKSILWRDQKQKMKPFLKITASFGEEIPTCEEGRQSCPISRFWRVPRKEGCTSTTPCNSTIAHSGHFSSPQLHFT